MLIRKPVQIFAIVDAGLRAELAASLHAQLRAVEAQMETLRTQANRMMLQSPNDLQAQQVRQQAAAEEQRLKQIHAGLIEQSVSVQKLPDGQIFQVGEAQGLVDVSPGTDMAAIKRPGRIVYSGDTVVVAMEAVPDDPPAAAIETLDAEGPACRVEVVADEDESAPPQLELVGGGRP